jgi:hypothetical protein
VKKTSRKQTRVTGSENHWAFEFFHKHRQLLLPLIDLIEQSRAAIDEMIEKT